MFTGEAASGWDMAVEMGKAADDNEEPSSTNELSGQKVKAQGVTDQHKTWSVRM